MVGRGCDGRCRRADGIRSSAGAGIGRGGEVVLGAEEVEAEFVGHYFIVVRERWCDGRGGRGEVGGA